MSKVIDVETRKEVLFSKDNLPVLIHGEEHSGASLFSIVLTANFIQKGNKMSVFTAFPMAKEELKKQVGDDRGVVYFKDESALVRGLKESSDNIIFIKNIEVIQSKEVVELLEEKSRYILSGDVEKSVFKKELQELEFKTRVLFSKLNDKQLPKLEKYQACFQQEDKKAVVMLG